MAQVNPKRLLVMALYAGEIMLKNGAETYRVEDTIIRLCKSRQYPFVDAYVTPTGIIISVDNEGEDHNEMITYVKRITNRGINLDKVAQVNQFSRHFVESDLSIEAAMGVLKEIDRLSPYPLWLSSIFGGIASAFFALLYGANGYEFLASLITSFLINLVISKLGKTGFNTFISNMIGGSLAAAFALFFSQIHSGIQVDIVVIGAIMTMVPGVAITNALRDTIAGDLVSGLARGTEALLVAISIAIGVASVLKTWTFIVGGVF